MASDRNFYCDFRKGLIGSWSFNHGQEVVTGDFTLARPADIIVSMADHPQAGYHDYCLDGIPCECSWAHAETAYMSERGLRLAFLHKLPAGQHILQVRRTLHENMPMPVLDVSVNLSDNLPVIKTAPAQDYIVPCPDSTVWPAAESFTPGTWDGYKQGVGKDQVSIGRFGFTKGDGLLDCAMTTLGGINRMYLFGHPHYKKNTRWQYSVLPIGIDPQSRYHGSYAPAQVGYADDEVTINYVTTRWATVFKRSGASDVKFACTYSLASAGIMIETDDCQLSLSELKYAGNYTRILLPLAQGLTIRDISSAARVYDRAVDGELQTNWFLVFGADTFPDIPLQIIMTQKPQTIELHRRDSRLSGLDVKTVGAFGVGFTVAPFGVESFLPGESVSDEFIADAVQRCSFWSKAVLAYPIDAEEFYKIDEANEKVDIVQHFQHRTITDAWGTVPLRTAPLPPVFDLAADVDGFTATAPVVDYQFPSKYGFLKGGVNTDTSSYSLPLLPERRRFYLRTANDDAIADELAEGFDDYWNFMEKFPVNEVPLWPHCGGYLERYRFICDLFHFLPPARLQQLREKFKAHLRSAADPDHAYTLVQADFSALMRNMPDADEVERLFTDKAAIRKKFYNFYDRREPISGATYKTTFFNPGIPAKLVDGERDEVAKKLTAPLIEVDWGLGLSFNAMFLAALIADDWEALRAHWNTLREGFRYFQIYQDWACMSAAYAEHGVAWCEGANYNAFIGFCRIAEALGLHDDLDWGRYLGAKQGAFRIGRFRAAYTYLHKYFRCAPWWTVKLLHDEAGPGLSFQNVPALRRNAYRFASMFTLTTEGLFPEAYMLYLKHIPDEYRQFMQIYRDSLNREELAKSHPRANIQEHAAYLASLALSGDVDIPGIESEIAYADELNVMMRKWHEIRVPIRYLPVNYFQSYLKSVVLAKDWPIWLEAWQNLDIQSAVYDARRHGAIFSVANIKPGAMIECGATRPPAHVTLNDIILPFVYLPEKHRLIARPGVPGRLVFDFKPHGTQKR